MTDPTPDDLATLARAMGYSVTLDDSGGYGVVRVIYTDARRNFRGVFDPNNDSEQALDVTAWLMRQDKCNDIDGNSIRVYLSDEMQHATVVDHDGTAAGIRRAVVEAAIRVAKD